MKLINKIRYYNIERKIKNADKNLDHLFDYDKINPVLNGTFIMTKSNKMYYIVQSHMDTDKLLFYGIECTNITACSSVSSGDIYVYMPQILSAAHAYNRSMTIELSDIDTILRDKSLDRYHIVYGIHRFSDIMKVIFNEMIKDNQVDALTVYNKIFTNIIPPFTHVFGIENMDEGVIISPNVIKSNKDEGKSIPEIEPHSMIVTPDIVYYVKECIESFDDAHIINGFMINNHIDSILDNICGYIIKSNYDHPTVEFNMCIIDNATKVYKYEILKENIIFILTRNSRSNFECQTIATSAYEKTKQYMNFNNSLTRYALSKYKMCFNIEHIIGVNFKLAEDTLHEYLQRINSQICTNVTVGSIIVTKNNMYYILDICRDDIGAAFNITGFILKRIKYVTLLSPNVEYVAFDMYDLLKGSHMIYDDIVPYEDILFILHQSLRFDILYPKIRDIFNLVSSNQKVYNYTLSDADVSSLYNIVVSYDVNVTPVGIEAYSYIKDNDTPIGDDINAFTHLQD